MNLLDHVIHTPTGEPCRIAAIWDNPLFGRMAMIRREDGTRKQVRLSTLKRRGLPSGRASAEEKRLAKALGLTIREVREARA